MAHFGSLFAVMVYFRKDVGGIISGFFDLIGRKLNTNSALALNLIIATPPALALGFFLSDEPTHYRGRRSICFVETHN